SNRPRRPRHLLAMSPDPNQHRLFQHLNGLSKDAAAFSDLKQAILNHGTDAILRMERIRSLNTSVLSEFRLFADQMNLKDDKVVFSSASMGALLSEISPLLSTIRILQNKTLALVSVWESISLPQSMNDFMKKKESYNISSITKQLIEGYWEKSGKFAKFYRDIDQHDFLASEVTSRYFVMHQPEAITYVELPDFQTVMKRSEFTYTDGTNALEFLDDACFEVHELIECISITYGADPSPITPSTRLAQLGDLTPYRPRTLATIFEQKVKKIDGRTTLNIGAIRIDQLKDGRLEFAKIVLDDEKVATLNAGLGSRLDKS
ncbi:MAG: hypothetical protein ACPH5G_06985, partial [Pseudooceanicola atlanticus]